MGQGRVELPTSRLSGVRSNHLSYWPDRDPLFVRAAPSGPRTAVPPRSLKTGLYALRRGIDLRFVPKHVLRKEVIQPQVPLRLPCYDFTPVTNHSLGAYLLAVGTATSGAIDSHGVTGGVYKARERIHRCLLISDY